LGATLELVGELGPEGLTMEAIARRAMVSKETLYRWWRSKTEVLLEALAFLGDVAIPAPDNGSLATDLRDFMRSTASALDAPTRRALRALAAGAASDEMFADRVRIEFLDKRRAAIRTLLEHAVDRGELDCDVVDVAIDLVFGSLWYRTIFGIGKLDKAWADGVSGAVARMGT
jgi:AcrR family transcriptional regulator